MFLSISYWVHAIAILVFVPFLFLPVSIRQWEKSGRPLASASIWKGLFHLGHLYIVLSLITGLILAPSYTSSWFWFVILIFLAVGALLGITAKYFRLSLENTKQHPNSRVHLAKLRRFSTLLAISILLISILMYYRW